MEWRKEGREEWTKERRKVEREKVKEEGRKEGDRVIVERKGKRVKYREQGQVGQ